MFFKQVSILDIACLDAPHIIPSSQLEEELAPTLQRLQMRPHLLQELSGIQARRFWDTGVQPSEVATQAAVQVLEQAKLERSKIGVVISTSVCKDYIEPSVASLVHGNLKLSPNCLNFDIGNACLAFLNAMEIAGNMIERGQIDYALVVDGEGSRSIIEKTVARLLQPECDEATFRKNFATLTLGSGAVSMILCRRDLAPEGHPFLGGVSLAASQYNRLCLGQPDEMLTDASTLLVAGLQLAAQTYAKAKEEMDWHKKQLDELVLHQVSAVHTNKLAETLQLDMQKIYTIYQDFGNIGPAALPIVLAKTVAAGRVKPGDRVALLGIGSGLNCAMMEVLVVVTPIPLFIGQHLSLNGLRYHYVDEGQGEPLLMLHGNPTWSIYYRNLIRELSPDYRCIVPDHMGCGFSDKPDDAHYSYTLEQRVRDVEALLEHLNIHENLTLIVHDWGGMIGMTYAARHPEVIKRMIIFNTAAFHLPPTKSFPWPLWLSRTPLGSFLIQRGNAFSLAASLVGCTRKRMSKALRQAYRSPYNSPANRIATLRFVQDIPLHPEDPGYDLISQVQQQLSHFQGLPTLICWGEKDFVFDQPFLDEWLKYLPQAEVHRFPDCGHYILEDAQEEIIPLVKQFLMAHPLPL